jgi:TDG/mug DNA glycosylase family protein
LSPSEEQELLEKGYGITNLVERSTAGANELTGQELIDGRHRLEVKVSHFRPVCVAILSIGAYRQAFGRPGATIGEQPETIADARLWVLPNPSGLNAHYQLEDLAQLYQNLRLAVERTNHD